VWLWNVLWCSIYNIVPLSGWMVLRNVNNQDDMRTGKVLPGWIDKSN
jgi:hypothetical protein